MMGEFASLPWAVIVTVAGGLLTTAAAWGAFRKTQGRMVEDFKGYGMRVADAERVADQTRMDLAMYKLSAAETYVRNTDLQRMEDRLGKRLDTLELILRTRSREERDNG